MGQPFLGADDRNRFGFRVDGNVVLAFIPSGNSPQESRYSLGSRIAVGFLVADNLDQFIHNGLGRRIIRVSHAEIDDILPLVARRQLFGVEAREKIGWEFFNEIGFGLDWHWKLLYFHLGDAGETM